MNPRFVDASIPGQSAHNLFRHSVCAGRDLLWSLVLYGMLDIDRVKAGASQRIGLNARRGHELSGGDRHCGNPHIFQMDRVVQTARCARSSIGQGFYYSVRAAQLFDDLRRCNLREGRFARADDPRCAEARAQDLFQTIEKKTAPGLADVEQGYPFSRKRTKPRWWRSRMNYEFIAGMHKCNGHRSTSLDSVWKRVRHHLTSSRAGAPTSQHRGKLSRCAAGHKNMDRLRRAELLKAALSPDRDLTILCYQLGAFAAVQATVISDWDAGVFEQKLADLLLGEAVAMERLNMLRAQDHHGFRHHADTVTPNRCQGGADGPQHGRAILSRMLAHSAGRFGGKQ